MVVNVIDVIVKLLVLTLLTFFLQQISGLYENVRNALLQVTSRLRNLFFSTIISNAAEHVQNCCSVDSNFTSSDREKAVYCGSDDLICFSSADPDMNITLEMNRLGFLNEVKGRQFTNKVAGMLLCFNFQHLHSFPIPIPMFVVEDFRIRPFVISNAAC